jgi:hypothetical protein
MGSGGRRQRMNAKFNSSFGGETTMNIKPSLHWVTGGVTGIQRSTVSFDQEKKEFFLVHGPFLFFLAA